MNNPAPVCLVPYANMMQPNIPCMTVHNDCITITRKGGCLPLVAVIRICKQRGIPPEYFSLNAGKPVITVCFLSPPLVKVWDYPRHLTTNILLK